MTNSHFPSSAGSEELDLCPICRSRLVGLFEREDGLFIVSCENDDNCQFTVQTIGGSAKEAVRKWNTRITVDAQAVGVREALELCEDVLRVVQEVDNVPESPIINIAREKAKAALNSSQAKEPEASGGLCAVAPHAVRVGEASADLPATSELMDVTAGETAPHFHLSADTVPARETVARILAHKMPSLRMANDTPGNYAHSIADEIVAALTNEPQAAQLTDVLASCKGEHSKFEEWAATERYDMQEHPIHYLFTDPKTYAARQGWKAALRYVSSSLSRPHGGVDNG